MQVQPDLRSAWSSWAPFDNSKRYEISAQQGSRPNINPNKNIQQGREERRELLLENVLIGAVRFVLRQRAVELLDIGGLGEEVVETGFLESLFI
jgi:hypothetical protein